MPNQVPNQVRNQVPNQSTLPVLVEPVREKHFNTAGPNIASLHYELDPLVRIDSDAIDELIEQQRYFVLHAPRQTGKTTCLLAVRDHLNRAGKFAALYVNIEGAQAARNDVAAAASAIVSALAQQAEITLNLSVIEDNRANILARGAFDAVQYMLRLLASTAKKPVVLILDEVDALVGDSLISLLRQIRAGYGDRPANFPQEKEGLAQIERYLNRLNLPEGFLVIFDQRAKPAKWEKRMHISETKTISGRRIWVFRG